MYEIYDLEILTNLFTYTGYCLQNKQWYQFVIHSEKNQIEELYNHLTRGIKMQIGFNNEHFDYPLLHWFLVNYSSIKNNSGFQIANDLYQVGQHLINSEEITSIWDNNKFIPQTDLYLIHHYNNKARRCSLKDVEFALRMNNIEEMPYDHRESVYGSQIDEVLEYNKNDVEATRQLLLLTIGRTDNPVYKNKDKIDLRKKFLHLFGLECHNYPDVKIGAELLLKKYCEKTNKDYRLVRKIRGKSEYISLKECIPSWCNITSKPFLEFLEVIKNTRVSGAAKEFTHSAIFHGISFNFGLGGSHGCIKSGVYKSNKDWVIMDLDIASLYPSIIISLGLYPKTLGPEFLDTYINLRDDRVKEKHKKEGKDQCLIEGYKLCLNGIIKYKF